MEVLLPLNTAEIFTNTVNIHIAVNCNRKHSKILCLDVVQQHTGARCAVLLDGSVYDLFESGLAHEEVHLKLEFVFGNRSVNKAQILRDRIVEDDLADGGFHQRRLHHAVDLHFAAYLDFGVQLDNTGLICHHNLVHVAEHLALAALTGLVEGEVVLDQWTFLKLALLN